MTFIRLRKRTSKPEPEAAKDLVNEAEEPEATPEEEVPGFFRALLDGVKGWWAWCTRLVGPAWAGGAHLLALWAIKYYGGWVALGICLTLVVAVAWFIPRASVERLATRLEKRLDVTPPAAADDAPEPAAEQPPQDPLITLLWHLIDTAPGVHFKTLSEHLTEGARREGREPPTRAGIEAALTARQIPLRPSVRNTLGKVNKGVHRDDLLAAEQAPSPADTAPPP